MRQSDYMPSLKPSLPKSADLWNWHIPPPQLVVKVNSQVPPPEFVPNQAYPPLDHLSFLHFQRLLQQQKVLRPVSPPEEQTQMAQQVMASGL